MKKQYLLLTLALAFLPLYSMESTEDFNTQLNAHVASDAFEQNFINDFTEKSIEDIVETIKGLNQCFSSLSDENATKIQTIIREKLSDNQQKAIFQKLLEQQEWNVATSCAIWSDKTNGQWSALIEPLLNQNNTDALQALITLVPADNPLSLKMHLALSFQPLLDNKNWQEAAQWILNNINNKKQSSALTPYLQQLITEKNFDALQILQSCFSKDDFLYNHIQLAIEDHTTQNLPIEQTIQNSNNNNDDNSRMENDNVSTQPNLHSDSNNNNNEKTENKNRQTATIITSDGQRDLDATEFGILKSESVTIANLLEDFQEEEHGTIPLEITSDQFNEILSLLKIIHENKSLSNKKLKEIIIKQLHEKQSEKQEVTGKEGKQEEEPATAEYSVKKLITLLKTANFLDIQLLLDCSLDLLAERLVTPDELKQFIEGPEYLSMFELPVQLSKIIATKISASCWATIADKLDIDFFCKVFNVHKGKINSVAFSSDRRFLGYESTNNSVCLGTVDQPNPTTHLQCFTNINVDDVDSVAFSPSGRLLVTGCIGGAANAYSIKEDNDNPVNLLTTLIDQNDEESALSVSFSPNGRFFAIGCLYGKVNVYSIKEDNDNPISLLATLNDHQKDVSSVSFSPNGRFFSTGCLNGKINVYSIEEEDTVNPIKFLATLDDHREWIRSVAFSPNSSLLASAYRDNVVKIYSIEEEDIVNSINLLTTFNNDENSVSSVSSISSVAFSPNGSLLAIGSGKRIRIYAIDEKNTDNPINLLTTFENNEGLVNSIAFSPDSCLLAVGSNDGVKIYDLNDFIFLQTNAQLEQILFLTFCCNKNDNKILDFSKCDYLQSIFKLLPDEIKDKLIEKGIIKRNLRHRFNSILKSLKKNLKK